MYETFEHTADVGLRVRAPELDTLFAEAGRGMFSIMVANLEAVRPIEAVQFALEGEGVDVLLRSWLAELLYTFQVRRLLLSEFAPAVRPGGLTAIARGEPLDAARHQADIEIKAVTWHGLTVRREAEGWLAEVILDI
ncbi:MAG: archease [Thermoguttaceae bacterium]|jgi:SHS2 domain-containing protein